MINQKQLLVMLALGGVWAGLLMWRLVSTEEPAHVPLVHVTGQSSPLTRTLMTWTGAVPLSVTLLLATLIVLAEMVKVVVFSAAIWLAILAWA